MMRGRRRAAGSPAATLCLCAFGFGALLLLFSPYDEPDAHRLFLDPRPAAEAVGLVTALATLAFFGARLGGWARGLLAVTVLAAGFVGLLDAALPMLFGRRLEAYWDLRHVPSLIGLLVDSAGPLQATLIFAGAATAILAGWAIIALALAGLWRAFADRRIAASVAAAGMILLGIAFAYEEESARPVSLHAGAAIRHHAAALYRGWQIASGRANPYSAALAAPALPRPGLELLAGRDVYLVFVESYGTAVLDRPDFAATLAPDFARFEETAARAGYALVSHRILSPTYGGGSWLAHAAVGSGIEVSDQFLYRLLVGGGRKTLAGFMAEAGYRTVQVMPGMKTPAPEDAFWGFEKRLYAADLGYAGPSFGWFAIPDQHTLKRVSEVAAEGDGRPLFLQAVLVSSHTPFAPVPPYVADWRDGDLYAGIPADAWSRIYAAPDWSRLEKPYVESIAYELQTLGGWLEHLPGDAVVVLLGDHEPPAFVAGAKQPWTVPIHILARDPTLVDRFAALGYTPGARPMQPAPWPRMADFMRDFFAAMSRDPPVIAREPLHPETAPN
jgi:hypothetical protein